MRNHATHAGSSLAQSVCEGRQKPNAAHPQLWQLSHALQIRQLLRSSHFLLTVCSRFSYAFAPFTRVSAQSRSPGKSVSASSATHTLPGAEHTPTLQVGRITQESHKRRRKESEGIGQFTPQCRRLPTVLCEFPHRAGWYGGSGVWGGVSGIACPMAGRWVGFLGGGGVRAW